MADSTPTTITLNGDPYAIDGDLRLSALLERLNMRRGRVAVEINREIVPKASYPATIIKPGDSVEIINFVGGG
jgi:thiamine biosynthesis protein ThiS